MKGKMEGAAAAPPHPRAAAARVRPWSRRSGAPGCGDVSCARRCMAPAGSRGHPRLLTRPGPSREAARQWLPLQPAVRGPPTAGPPRPHPAVPDARQAPYPRGAGPRGALPRMSVPASSGPRAQGPEHRAGASPLSRSLFLSCSQAVLALARTPYRSRSLPRTRPPTPAQPTPVFIRRADNVTSTPAAPPPPRSQSGRTAT